nr:uncharacterized mitochondrial protein AtMg00810-like [Tanacetum cinerariifolium]
MSTKQDIYAAGSKNRPPMLNKDNYVPWSSHLLHYAKIKPNEQLIYKSIMNDPYVRRMIPEPGNPNREVLVVETFHEQTDDELTEKEVKQIEADDQAILIILIARDKGNGNGNNGNQIRCYNYRGLGHLARNCIQASTSGTQIDKAPVYDSDGSAKYVNGMNSRVNNLYDNVSKTANQKKDKPKITKPKKVGSKERLASPKPRKPRTYLRWSPTGRRFDLKGKIIESSESESQSNYSKGTVRFGNDHVAAILGYDDLQWGNILITKVYFVEGLGVYNRRTKKIIETMNVTFDELSTMAFEQHNLLFKAMYDDYIGGQPSTATRTASATQAPQVLQTLAAYTTAYTAPTTYIVHATCLCARYQAKPTEKHLEEVKRIFHYLYETVNMGCWHTKDSRFELIVFSDADYARCKDTFKSTSSGTQFLGLDNTAKTKRPQPWSNTKNDRVLFASKSSCIKNKEVKVEEHHKNLLLSKNKKHMSYECNNVKLAIRNDKSEVICAMCKQCLITSNHDVCVLKYVNGMNSRVNNLYDNVSKTTNQKKDKPKITKPKKVGSKERLASPKPRKPRTYLRWSPTGRMFDLKGKIIESSESESQSNCSKGTVHFGNDHVAAILGYGDLQWGNILITKVYFVKGLGYNPFLVGQFCDLDLEVAFRRNTCFVRNLKGVYQLKGNRITNLYTINLCKMSSASPICLMDRATSTKS